MTQPQPHQRPFPVNFAEDLQSEYSSKPVSPIQAQDEPEPPSKEGFQPTDTY